MLVLISSKTYVNADSTYASNVSLQGSPHRRQQTPMQSAEHARHSLGLAERPCLRTSTLSYLPQRQDPSASAYPLNVKCMVDVAAATNLVASRSARFQRSMSVDDDKTSLSQR